MGWVDPWVRLGRDFSVFLVGWVGSTIRSSASKVEATKLVRWSLHAGLLGGCRSQHCLMSHGRSMSLISG